MDSAAGLRPSALDLLAALLTGRASLTKGDGDNHRQLLALLATSLAMLVGCGVALLVRRSSASTQAVKAPPVAAANKAREEEPDPDDGRQRVALLFGTKTGTAEDFG